MFLKRSYRQIPNSYSRVLGRVLNTATDLNLGRVLKRGLRPEP